jgi:hypothetical protein
VFQGTQITIDILARQIGNWYYPIVGGPMDGLLFPFKCVPYDGQNLTFEFYLNPRHDYYIYPEDRGEYLWPGIDLDLVRRQSVTLHEYRFYMPYLYYMGETLK